MGDLAVDTAIERVGDGRYTARMDRDWEIWGPMGGYVASVAMRAVGVESPATVPASFFCQYHGVAGFDAVDIDVTALKAGRTVAFHRATVTQDGRSILEATVCSVGESASDNVLEHVDIAAPEVEGPDGLASFEELRTEDDPGPPFPFWNNFDGRPLDWIAAWPPPEALKPEWRQWLRFLPTATFADPWVDACRALVLVDVQSWPAAHRPHAWRQEPLYAPSLDLYVAFHSPPPWGEWLLTDGHSAVAGGGLMGWTGRLWSDDRRLLASGGGQLLVRRAAG